MKELNNRVFQATKKDNKSFYINENILGDAIEIIRKYSINYMSFNERISLFLNSIKAFTTQE